MDIAKYKEFVWGLINPNIPAEDLPVYLSGKLLNEVSELFEVLYSVGYSAEKFADEAGDILWYLVNLYSVFNLDFPENTTNFQDCELYEHGLLVASGKLSGNLLKKRYHGKVIEDEVLTKQLNDSYIAFNHLLRQENVTLNRVMENNHQKLSKRHGETFNAAFYQSKV